jgi:solute:Na+ symporter, SSS family
MQASQFESVLSASLYAYTIYGAAVTPVIMAVFFWPRATTAGAIACIASGTTITILWRLAQSANSMGLEDKIGSIDAVYPALACSVVSLIVVSLMTQSPGQDVVAGGKTSS